jgi:16S rRNA pseudouridine516 synthase
MVRFVWHRSEALSGGRTSQAFVPGNKRVIPAKAGIQISMKLHQILFSQGFGTRRECSALIARGAVSVNGVVMTRRNEDDAFDTNGLVFSVNGEAWTFQSPAYLMLNKPTGYECSHKPTRWPSVYELLPEPLRNRPTKTATSGVQAIGRLDQDTTGLLIFSDDGQFIHRMASPKWHVPKRYAAQCAREVTSEQLEALRKGVVLNDDPQPIVAIAAESSATNEVQLTIDEGKYHQVKRMIAAVGNHVESLHRAQIGALSLPSNLAEGQWRWLSNAELALISPR